MKPKQKYFKHSVDIVLTCLLLCLMAYQVTGEWLHGWLGIGMTVLVIVHQILNRKWYNTLFKGKYKAYRILQTVINGLLLLSFAMTAFCGMAMSAHAVPFLSFTVWYRCYLQGKCIYPFRTGRLCLWVYISDCTFLWWRQRANSHKKQKMC